MTAVRSSSLEKDNHHHHKLYHFFICIISALLPVTLQEVLSYKIRHWRLSTHLILLFYSFYNKAVLYWALQILHLLPIKGLWQPCVEQGYHGISPTASAPFMSLGHIFYYSCNILIFCLHYTLYDDL